MIVVRIPMVLLARVVKPDDLPDDLKAEFMGIISARGSSEPYDEQYETLLLRVLRSPKVFGDPNSEGSMELLNLIEERLIEDLLVEQKEELLPLLHKAMRAYFKV